MKLLIVATLVAVASAGRLEHLERGYLPPDQSGSPSFGSQSTSNFGSASNFGSNGFGASAKSGSLSHSGATSNQYLPPDHGPSAGNGFGSAQGRFSQGSQNKFGSQSGPSNQYLTPFAKSGSNGFGSQGSSNGFGSQGSSNGFGSQGSSNGFGSHGASHGASHGSNGFGAHGSSNGFGAQDSNGFGSASNSFGVASNGFGQQSGNQGQFGAASRQYLAPKASGSQDIPQQAFDEQTGYHY